MSPTVGVSVGGRGGFQRFANGFGLLAVLVSVGALVVALGLAVAPRVWHHHHDASQPSYLRTKPAPPVRLNLTDTGTVVPIVASTTSVAQGIAQAPTDAPLVTWWRTSAMPGAAHGETVLLGHAKQDKGALVGIGHLAEGAFVDLLTGQGTNRYRVTSVRSLDQARFDGIAHKLESLDGGNGRLVMISAQEWDGIGYQRLVVVTAKWLGEPSGS